MIHSCDLFEVMRSLIRRRATGRRTPGRAWAGLESMEGRAMLSAPSALLNVSEITVAGGNATTFTVQYTDLENAGVDVSTLDSQDIRIAGPNGFNILASFVSLDTEGNGTPRTATYAYTAPGGTFNAVDNGTYFVTLESNQVADIHGAFSTGGSLGTFQINIPDTTAPTASLTATTLTATNATTYSFFIEYTDDIAIDTSSVSTGNIRVTGPGGFDQIAAFVTLTESSNGTPRTALFRISAPDTLFTVLDNGTYTVTMISDQVNDTSANFVPAGTIGQFDINIPDVFAPTITSTSISSATPGSGDSSYTFTVTYADNVAVDFETLNSSDIRVTGPNSLSVMATFLSVDVASDGTPRVATYRFNAPNNGTFGAGDNGQYNFAIVANQVADTANNFVPAANIGSFTLSLPDLAPPTATVTITDITVANVTSKDFTVAYADDVALNFSTFDNSDLRVTGPNGFDVAVTFVTANINTNGSPRTVTYRFAGPGVGFTFADNGTYTISMVESQVGDSSGNFMPAGVLTTFLINVPDVINPSAAFGSVENITTPTSTPHLFTVIFSDNDQIKIASLDNSDIRITGPNGFSALATFVSVDPNTNGSPRTATYSITGPGGAFGPANNGTYNISLVASQVLDVTDNPAPSGDLGSFTVTIPDTIAPTAAPASVADIRLGGAASTTFTVTYSDDVVINVATLDSSDVLVTGPGGFSQLATFVSISVAGNGTPRTATYRINAPGGTFDKTDNGTYTLTLQATQVTDLTGNPVASLALGTFLVDVPEVFGVVNGTNTKLTLADPDGTLVTFTLKGNGIGSVRRGTAGFTLELTGTDKNTQVDVTTKKSTASTDDSKVIFESVLVGPASTPANGDSINTFTAKTANLTGPFTVNGTLGSLTLDDLQGSALISVRDQIQTRTAVKLIKLDTITDGSINSVVNITTLQITAWNDATAGPDLLTAPAIGTLTVKGNFNADVSLTNGTSVALSKATIGGIVNGANFRIAGSVGTVTIGALINSNFFAGINQSITTPPTSPQIISVQTINSLTIKGVAGQTHAVVNSNIAASVIKTLKLVKVQTANTGTPFGVVADTITTYSRDNVRLTKRVQPATLDVVGDYRLTVV